MEDRDITFLQSTFQQLSQLTTTVLQGEIKLKQEQTELKQQQIQFQKEKEEFEKKKQEWNHQKESDAFKILKELPPSMHNKCRNEHFPIVRFCYNTQHRWYQNFIERYHDLCFLLRNIHDRHDCDEGLQIQIAAIFHFKNFPALTFSHLQFKVKKLVKMLEDIKEQIHTAQFLEHINWFKHLEYPLDEARQPITVVHLDTDPNFMRNLEAIRTVWSPEEYISDEEEEEEQPKS